MISPKEILTCQFGFMDEIFHWFGLLNNFSNHEFTQAICSHSEGNHSHLAHAARTADFNFFNDIILLSNNLIVYQGPCEHMVEFSELVDFKCIERKDLAFIFQEVSLCLFSMTNLSTPVKVSFICFNNFYHENCYFMLGETLMKNLLTELDKSKSLPAALTSKKVWSGKMGVVKSLHIQRILSTPSSFCQVG